jgi:hypothetical protein
MFTSFNPDLEMKSIRSRISDVFISDELGFVSDVAFAGFAVFFAMSKIILRAQRMHL